MIRLSLMTVSTMIPIAIFANESTEEEDADYLPFSDNDEPVIPR